MADNDNDIHVKMTDKADQLKNKVRKHSVRVSLNANDDPTPRPKNFRNFKVSDNNGSVV